jgi:glycosyltransferase involved in cell wall biosynthesis
MQLSITVVIPALNAANTLGRQLAALAAQVDAPPFVTVVVDNGSDDATADVAGSFDSETMPVSVVSEPRRGINRARNAGVSAAADGIVLLCDADDVVAPTWVSALSSAVDQRSWGAGVVDYASANDDDTLRVWGVRDMGVPAVPEPFVVDAYVDRTFGGCCGFTKEMWRTVGGFDDRLSGSGDENEFFGRAALAGFRPRVAMDARVAYTLRSGRRAWLRYRYRSGYSQGRTARLASVGHLQSLCRPWATLLALAKLVAASPVYAWHADRRQQWLGGLLRASGRLRGWYSRH